MILRRADELAKVDKIVVGDHAWDITDVSGGIGVVEIRLSRSGGKPMVLRLYPRDLVELA